MRVLVLATLALVACGEKDHVHSEDSTTDDSATDDSQATGLEIAGSYTDSWGGSHTVSETSWVSGSSSWAVAAYDNDGDWLVAQNASTNAYFPDLWSRFDWTWDGADLYYCQFAYDAASQADAEAATGADRADLAGGCNGFGWTQLSAAR